MVTVYGSKYQVYKGTADQTRGGLVKKDIVKVEDKWGTIRYRSKKQQNKVNNWIKAYTKVIGDSEEFKTIYKPGKSYPGVSKKDLKKGQELYRKTMALKKRLDARR